MSSKKREERDYFLPALLMLVHKTGVKQTELCEKTGILQGRISEILNGKYSAGKKVQTKIARALGYDLVDFLALGRMQIDGEETRSEPETVTISRTEYDLLKQTIDELRADKKVWLRDKEILLKTIHQSSIENDESGVPKIRPETREAEAANADTASTPGAGFHRDKVG